MNDNSIDSIKSAIPIYDDWPKPGIQYMNTVELCSNPRAFYDSITWFAGQGRSILAKDIFAADARGFIWGSALASEIQAPLYLARKPGKLPGNVVTKEYNTEYSTASLSMLKDSNIFGNVMIVDDILATGGTLNAVGELLTEHWNIKPNKQLHATLACLDFLPGKKMLESKKYKLAYMELY